MSNGALRVIDFGPVSPLQSQTLWHAIAHGVSAGSPPTLAFMQPDAPYVSIGFHRRLDEIDGTYCRAAGLPIYRRMVGGGPVYLDDGQIFFQIILPLAMAPPVRSQAVRTLLAPAVDAFQAVGIDASIEPAGDVVVGDKKICGHGAGQIENAVVVVGNLITRFDHTAAARIVAAPDEESRAEFEALMRRYVTPTPAAATAFAAAATMAYATRLGLQPVDGQLSALETEKLAEIDEDFVDDDWVRGSERAPTGVWQVKVKAGVFLITARAGGSSVRVSIGAGRILRVSLSDRGLNGATKGTEKSLIGMSVSEASATLTRFGFGGDRLAGLLQTIEQAVRA